MSHTQISLLGWGAAALIRYGFGRWILYGQWSALSVEKSNYYIVHTRDQIEIILALYWYDWIWGVTRFDIFSYYWRSICAPLLYPESIPPSWTFFVNTSKTKIGSLFGLSLWALNRSAINLGLTFGNMAEYRNSSSMADFFNPLSSLSSLASLFFVVVPGEKPPRLCHLCRPRTLSSSDDIQP